MSDLSRNGARLHRWERWTDSEGSTGTREVTVDVRSVLTDALLGYDVPTGEIVAEFFRLANDPVYEAD